MDYLEPFKNTLMDVSLRARHPDTWEEPLFVSEGSNKGFHHFCMMFYSIPLLLSFVHAVTYDTSAHKNTNQNYLFKPYGQ